MSWTFAHPAAILPLRRLCPTHLSFPALIAGTLTPDFGYYIDSFALATYAHTLAGSFIVCLPIGLMMLALFYLVRRPIWYLLPQPHRTLLKPFTFTPAPLRLSAILATAISALLGAWSHIIWDAFTHRRGWAVVRLDLLQTPVLNIGSAEVAVYNVLQHLSTFVGVFVLIAAYRAWFRQREAGPVFRIDRSDLWRYALVSLLLLGSIASAIPLAIGSAATAEGYLAARVFLFHAAVYAGSLFVSALTILAVLCYYFRQTEV